MFRASSVPIIRSFLLTFGTGKFHAGLWWPLPNRVRMECQMYSRKLLMMGREDVRNM